MRIISGKNKGKKLLVPKDMSVRPTADKVKEAIFNMIGYIDENSVVLDLFAGTGNIGIEFLCRGAKKAYFVDVSTKSISYVKKNITNCKLTEESKILVNDYEKALRYFIRCGYEFDYIFADAPYKLKCASKIIDLVFSSNLLKKDGILIIECEKQEKLFETSIPSMIKYKEKTYGITKIGMLGFSEE